MEKNRAAEATKCCTTALPYSMQCRKFRVPTTQDTPLPFEEAGTEAGACYGK